MLLPSCSSTEEITNIDDGPIVDMRPADPKPISLTAEQKVFASDNNAFTLNFLKTADSLSHKNKSFIYSPLSITYVLGMVNDAATGITEQEIEQTLGFHEGGIAAVNAFCKQLIDNLPEVDAQVQLNIANAIFLNNRYKLKQQFKKDMEAYYDAKAEVLDFAATGAAGRINQWCNEKTKGLIPKILDSVDKDKVSYLLNAIYFKADWTNKFDEKNTREETFTTPSGDKLLPLMHQEVLINYVHTDLYSAVTIPYGNGLWNMTVLLPEEQKTTDDVISKLAETGWAADYSLSPMSGARTYQVDLKLPRFETSSDTDETDAKLIGMLRQMGIHQVFDSVFAEVPNMCEDQNLYISLMRQKARIIVNEKGSEAAAVTVAGMNKTTSVGPEPVIPRAVFHANRPFVYVIREASSGVIVFVGKFTGE